MDAHKKFEKIGLYFGDIIYFIGLFIGISLLIGGIILGLSGFLLFRL